MSPFTKIRSWDLTDGEDQNNFNLPFMFVATFCWQDCDPQHPDPTPLRDQPDFEHAKIQASRWTSRRKQRPQVISFIVLGSQFVEETHNMERKGRARRPETSAVIKCSWSCGSSNADPTLGSSQYPQTAQLVLITSNFAHTLPC